MSKTLTIIIPAFNESKRILKTLDEMDKYILLNPEHLLFEVIIVNDGSIDDTANVVTKWIEKGSNNKNDFKLLSYLSNKGKGYAVREGFYKSKGDFVLYMDADGAAPISEVAKLLLHVNNGFDVAIGSRVLQDENSKVSMSFVRRFTGRIFHLILNTLGLASFKDTQCGFKLFRAETAKKLAENQKCFNYSFDIEYLFLLKKFGYKIKEVPINWYHVEGSKVNLTRDSIKMLIEVLKIRFLYRYNIKNLEIKG